MAKPTFEEIVAPITQADVFRSMVEKLGILGVDVSSWPAGAPTRTIIALCAEIQAGFTKIATDAIKGVCFRDTSSGAWLRILAWFRNGIQALEATAATGYVTVTNTNPVPSHLEFDPGDLVVPASNGRSYANTAAFTLDAGESLSVQLQCDVLGSVGNAGAGTLATTLPSIPGLTISQPSALVGTDQESDPALRTRMIEQEQALSGAGPSAVYSYWAKKAVLPHGGVVTQVLIGRNSTSTTTQVVVGSGTESLDATDLEALRIWLLRTAVPQGVNLALSQAAHVAVDVSVTIWSPEYLNSVTTIAAVQAAVVAWFAAVPIGGYTVGPSANVVFRSGIESAVASALLDASGVQSQIKMVTAVLSGPPLDSSGNAQLLESEYPVARTISVQVAS